MIDYIFADGFEEFFLDESSLIDHIVDHEITDDEINKCLFYKCKEVRLEEQICITDTVTDRLYEAYEDGLDSVSDKALVELESFFKQWCEKTHGTRWYEPSNEPYNLSEIFWSDLKMARESL